MSRSEGQPSAECPACALSALRASSAGVGTFLEHEYRYLKCRDCGTVFVSPPPPPGLLERMYGPEYVQLHYSDDGATPTAEFTESVGLIAARKGGGRVLDVGCGSGAFLKSLTAARLNAEGFELNPDSARAASSRAGVPVHSGTLQTITSRYDAVHAADVLEHLITPLEMLTAFRELLVPDGILVARGPLEGNATLFDLVMRSRRRLLSLRRPAHVEMPPWHLILFSLAGWRALFARAGFTPVDEQVSEMDWPSAPSGARRAVRVASLALSNSALGKRLDWGNRVVSVWKRDT